MCGVGAVVSLNNRKVDVRDSHIMKQLLHHRGPDSNGEVFLSDGRTALIHTRLAVVDQAHGQQPMQHAEAGISITYNGEIYDCDKLRALLTQKGYHFKTQSDTEVVLGLYVTFGLDMFDYMNGEYAFVIWDEKKKRVVSARDRFGIKPLFYFHSSEELVFASECKALIALGRVDPSVSSEYLLSSFMGNFIGHESFFSNIQSVKAGHVLVYEKGSLTETPYWEPSFTTKTTLSFEEAKSELNRLMRQAVSRRLVADVPVGSFLSGGIDSTIVTGLAAENNRGLKTFTVGFDGADFEESSIAKKTADALGLSCNVYQTDRDKMSSELIRTVQHIELPISSPQPVAMRMLSKYINSKGVKTCLSGDGADEIFGGYAFFKLDELRNQLIRGNLSAKQGRDLFKLFCKKEASTKVLLWYPDKAWRSKSKNGQVFNGHIRDENVDIIRRLLFPATVKSSQNNISGENDNPYDRFQGKELNSMDVNRLTSFNQLSSYIFPMQSDRVQMAHSVEGRTPFLDNDVVKFALSLPADYLVRLSDMKEKHILHETFRHSMPSHTRDLHKQPFHKGFTWRNFSSSSEGKDIWQNYMSYRSLNQSGIFNPSIVKAIIQLNKWSKNNSLLQLKTDLLLGNILTALILQDTMKQHYLLKNFA